MQDTKRKNEKSKNILTLTVFIILIIIIIILLLRSCKQQTTLDNAPVSNGTQGDWTVGDKQESIYQDPNIVPENITFSGSDKYAVSSQQKQIELTNPKDNQANFVFTITDTATGTVIAKTGNVAPGQYAYINIYDHYKKEGSYEVTIDIATYSYAGKQLNGANTKAVITIKQ